MVERRGGSRGGSGGVVQVTEAEEIVARISWSGSEELRKAAKLLPPATARVFQTGSEVGTFPFRPIATMRLHLENLKY